MTFSNFHTHTRYCDGIDTPAEMARAAVRLKCPALGFSEHSRAEAPVYGMKKEAARCYRREIEDLAKEFSGKLDITLGIEQDIDMGKAEEGYRYVIGSVHYLMIDGKAHPIDQSEKAQVETVNACFHGDFYAYIEAYYKRVSEVVTITDCNIIGHFDLISKFNQNNALYDPSHPRVRRAAEEALDALLNTAAVFEVNTGVIARGYRKEAYMEDWMLSCIRAKNKPVILSSDCHDSRNLLCHMEEEYARCKRLGVEVIDKPL